MQRQAPHQTTAKWRSAVDPQSRVPLASGPFSPRAVRLAALDSCWIQPPGSQAGAHGREMVAKPGGCGALGARAVLKERKEKGGVSQASCGGGRALLDGRSGRPGAPPALGPGAAGPGAATAAREGTVRRGPAAGNLPRHPPRGLWPGSKSEANKPQAAAPGGRTTKLKSRSLPARRNRSGCVWRTEPSG